MGIKWLDEKGRYLVWVSKRNPVTRMPQSLRVHTNEKRKPITSEKEARRIEKLLVTNLDNKINAINTKNTPCWKEVVTKTLTAMKDDDDNATKTILNYESYLKAFTMPIWGNKLIDEIYVSDVKDLINVKMVAAGKSYSSRKTLKKAIARVFREAANLGYKHRMDPTAIKIKPEKETIKGVLNEVQANILLERAKDMGCEWYPIWAGAIYTGMRNGELYALTWDNVDLENRLITVKDAWDNKQGFKGRTKNKQERRIEIAPPLLVILKELKAQNPVSKFVFPHLEKWTRGEQARELRFFLMGLGIKPINFHALRATWATIMFSRGKDLAHLKVMGGWSDLETLQIYLRDSGILLKGVTDDFILHNPSRVQGEVVQLHSCSNK